MSTFETYEGPFETQESYEGPFETQESYEGPFETGGYETYQGEDEQFLGDILGALTGEGESPLSEAQEVELATELLEITSEEELEEFLGNLFKGVAKSVGGFIKSPIGRQLGGILKSVAKKALPVVGGALGSFVAPGVGTAIGSKLGSMASGLFEMETAGMSQEQAQFEVARRYVRLAASAAQHAATAPRNAPPPRVVRTAITQAARQHAPGLLRGTSAGTGLPPRQVPRRPGAGAPPSARRPGARPLGAAAFPVGSSTVFVPGGNGDQTSTTVQPSYGPPQWAQPEPYEPSYGTPAPQYPGRAQRGRWMRRGSKIVLYGV
ncbi:MAG: hypothetical protein ACXVVQ_20960 [Solirubrobacteraceae bacterium]